MVESEDLCELQHCRLRETIMCEVQRREEKQDERFYALIEELKEELKDSNAVISNVKDIIIQGFIALIVTIIGAFVSYVLLNNFGIV